MPEISILRKLELRRTKLDKSLDCILKYYNMSVCYTEMLKLLSMTAVVKRNFFDFKMSVVRYGVR
jgi:hypothetical protein